MGCVLVLGGQEDVPPQPNPFPSSFTGVIPTQSSFPLHALIYDHYLKGGWYPQGGASEIAFHSIPIIERAGGAVLTKAPVQSILVNSQGKACGELDWILLGGGLRAWCQPG